MLEIMANSFSKGVIKEFLKKVLIGMGLGAGTDALVEIFRVPVLNDSGTFGDPGMSNIEYAAYAISVFGTAAGIADIGLGTGVLTFTKTGFPVLIGYGLGFYFWEHTFAVLFGVRKYDIYQYAGRLIPPVLPAGTRLPLTPGGLGYGGIPGVPGNAPPGPVHPALTNTVVAG